MNTHCQTKTVKKQPSFETARARGKAGVMTSICLKTSMPNNRQKKETIIGEKISLPK